MEREGKKGGAGMTDYNKLVESLRKAAAVSTTWGDILFLAADAIEELQAEQKKTVTQIFCEESHKWEELCKALMVQIKELKSQLDGPIITPQDGPIITPCRGCSDYDGYGGCKSKGGCVRKMEVQ